MYAHAIVSDVHANLEALNSVLEAIDRVKPDSIIFLGDSIGYGPDPNECIDLLRKRTDIMLAGNHDWGAVGLTDVSYFNPFARAAIDWTADVLCDKNRDFLQGLPLTYKLADQNIFLVHGTPFQPDKWHYMANEFQAYLNFRFFKEKICFLGHSHIPFIMERPTRGKIRFYYDRAEIKNRMRYIVNAGSAGQPRDGNPDAAYVVLRGNIIEIKRVSYDIVLTQKKMKKSGLPDFLIDRLSIGR